MGAHSDPEEGTAPAKKPGFLACLFRGDVSLARTFWLYGVLVPFLLLLVLLVPVACVVVVASEDFSDAAKDGAVYLYKHAYEPIWNGFFTVITGYIVFAYIAVWRSVGKYVGPRIWKDLAQTWVLVCWLSLLFVWVYLPDMSYVVLIVMGEGYDILMDGWRHITGLPEQWR